MTRKRRVNYPPPRSPRGPVTASGPQPVPPTVAVIDRRAILGRPEIVVGMRVTILGSGLYAGETATVQAVDGGVIPAAVVRTEAGRTRRVRTIDLVPAPKAAPAAAPRGGAAEAEVG